MMDLESELRSALTRKEPSPGFSERVVKKASRGPFTWRAAAAVVMLTALGGGWVAHTIAERRAGEHAREEVMLALHIASEKVHYAKTQVHEIGRSSR